MKQMSKKTIIHVNRQHIALNLKRHDKPQLPVYTVKRGSKNTYGYSVKITGPCVLVDPRESGQLSCGARAWIETDSPVEVIGAMTFQDVQKLK
jgi:hypothetical protein